MGPLIHISIYLLYMKFISKFQKFISNGIGFIDVFLNYKRLNYSVGGIRNRTNVAEMEKHVTICKILSLAVLLFENNLELRLYRYISHKTMLSLRSLLQERVQNEGSFACPRECM